MTIHVINIFTKLLLSYRHHVFYHVLTNPFCIQGFDNFQNICWNTKGNIEDLNSTHPQRLRVGTAEPQSPYGAVLELGGTKEGSAAAGSWSELLPRLWQPPQGPRRPYRKGRRRRRWSQLPLWQWQKAQQQGLGATRQAPQLILRIRWLELRYRKLSCVPFEVKKREKMFTQSAVIHCSVNQFSFLKKIICFIYKCGAWVEKYR